MSASFIPSTSAADYDQTLFGSSNSPPSLTTDSSPASSDSTGDEVHAKDRQRSITNPSTSGAAGLIGKGAFGVSPSIWNDQTQSLITNSHGLPKEEVFDAMSFGAWDSSFGSSLQMSHDGDISMDVESANGTEHAFSPHSSQSPAFMTSHGNHQLNGAMNANLGIGASPTDSDVKTGYNTNVLSNGATGIPISNGSSFAGSGEDSDGNAWLGKTSDNDDAMFDSLIQAGSFDSTNAVANSQSSVRMPPNPSGTGKTGSRRGSNEKDEGTKASNAKASNAPASSTSTRRHGSQTAVNSNNLDSDLGFSAYDIVRPPREELQDLQVHVHGVPLHGAKSRVETQIRMRLELVRPRTNAGTDATRPGQLWERIGSFTHIKLPPLSGTKRKSKKYQRTDVPPEKTLFVDATVVNATPPHDRVYVCKGCCQRERKRAHRKKDPKAPIDLQPTPEEMKSLGIDPSAPDATQRAQARMEEEEKKRVVLFNCGDYVDFEEGEAVLPTRITCYCRHHREKVGFCVIFTMRDWQGRLVATGSTPPIMITDDHKSMSIAAQAAAAAAAATSSQQSQAPSQPISQGVIKQVNGVSPRASVADGDDQQPSAAQGPSSGATTPNGSHANGDASQRRKDRAKPYSDSNGSRRRRNTSGKDLSMTPYSGTGTNTPAAGLSPPPGSEVNSTDFWNALSLAGSTPGFGRSSSVSNAGPKTPGGASSKANSPGPATNANRQTSGQAMPQMPPNFAQMEQGSLSPTTLQTNPQSLPPFDFEQFFRNAQSQMGASNGADIAQFMAMAAAAAMPGQTRAMPSLPNVPELQPTGNESVNQQPTPRISKLIPGEGPTSGGIEVTVLGEHFVEGITCVFGDVPASNTKVWASNTLVCVLPPSPSPGPVVVSLKGPPEVFGSRASSEGGPLQLFTYIDTTDRALMELALQVVGLQMTGQMRSAREVAMRVVGSGQQGGGIGSFNGASSSGGGQGTNHAQSREAISGLFTAGLPSQGETSSFQNSVMNFLSLLDSPIAEEDLPAGVHPRKDAIRLANKQGHTLLHLSVMMGFHRLVEVLLQRGCPIDARDSNGATALHFAALLGRVTITRLLLGRGARDDIPDASGLLPIDLAREKDQVDVEVVLAATPRTGRWTGHHMPTLSDSGVGISDDEDDLDDLEDAAELDDDNLSTSIGDTEDSYSQDDDDVSDSGEENEYEDEKVVDIVTSALHQRDGPSEKSEMDLEGDHKRSEADMEQNLSAFKSWLTRAGDTVGGVKLFPRPVADRFAQLHMPTMPAIPVFHLALPATPSMPFISWSSKNSESAAADGSSVKGKGKETEGNDREDWERDEQGRLLGMWRNILEESALWINPLYTPPPAYESIATENGSDDRVAGSSAESSSSAQAPRSRFPAIASTQVNPAASSDPSQSESTVSSLSRRTSQSHRHAQLQQHEQIGGSYSSSASGSSTPRLANKFPKAQSSSGTSTPTGRPKSASRGTHSRPGTASGNAASTATASTGSSQSLASNRKKRNLKDDAMLVWFWIPVLLVTVLVLLFSKSSSVLSFADLMSYLNLPLDYYRPQVPAGTIEPAL